MSSIEEITGQRPPRLVDHAQSGVATIGELAEDARDGARELVEEVREARVWIRVLLSAVVAAALVVSIRAIVRSGRSESDGGRERDTADSTSVAAQRAAS